MNNQQAFPTNQYANGISPSGHSQGMTLRDYFAAHCIQASLCTSLQMNLNQHQASQYAKFAYMAADEMMKAREQ